MASRGRAGRPASAIRANGAKRIGNDYPNPVPGTTTSVNTLNPTMQVQGPYAGSADSTAAMPFSGKLRFREAIQRGLQYNLGAVGLAQAVRQAQGASRVARSAPAAQCERDRFRDA